MATRTEQRLRPSVFVAQVGVFSALYIVVSIILAYLLPFLRGYPAHFFRGMLMSLLAMRLAFFGAVASMGLVSGLVFNVTVPTPAPYLAIASFLAGLIYDSYLKIGNRYSERSSSKKHVVVGTFLSGLGESVSAMAILTAVGLFRVPPVGLAFIWISAVSANLILGVVGALTTVYALRRISVR